MTANWESLVLDGVDARERHDKAHWLLGDLACQVETSYGESTLEGYGDAIGVDPGLLRDYRWVASRFESSKRSENLSWSHHRAVAARPDRLKWLQMAAQERLSIQELKKYLAIDDFLVRLWERVERDPRGVQNEVDCIQGVAERNLGHPILDFQRNVAFSAILAWDARGRD